MYFTLASVWGFSIGTAALVVGMSVLGRPLQLSTGVVIVLLLAAVLAVGGGAIASRAYRQASHR